MEITTGHFFVLRKSPVAGTIVIGVSNYPGVVAYDSPLTPYQMQGAKKWGFTVLTQDIYEREKAMGFIDYIPIHEQLHLFK